ncbi:auxin efflux carrier [Klebsiella pneumoniae]|nr:auxin efflux carrier [Klebsiella pneumoniae]
MTPFCLLILEREKARAAGENSGSTLAMLPVLMWRSVKKPIVWGPLLGVVLSAIGIKMPDLLLASIKTAGPGRHRRRAVPHRGDPVGA